MATWLEEHGVELVVLAGYMHLLTAPFLDRFPGRVVNVHPSLLPAFPGAHAIADAVSAGVTTTGVTIHYVDEGLDTGEVIRQEEVAVAPRATLEARIHAVEHRLLTGGGDRAVPRALISVYDKEGIAELGRGLLELGWELVSSGGTATHLEAEGLAVTRVEDVTGAPELLGGRVKTLHPNIHAGILARRDRDDDLAALAAQSIEPFDLVCVNLYPFASVSGRHDATEDEIVELIDVGGPSMLRAAAKNFAHVSAVSSPAQYGLILGELRTHGSVGADLRRRLAGEAFASSAAYEAEIARWFGGGEPFPGQLTLTFRKVADLPYGENPHQAAAFYVEPAARRHLLSRVEQLGGKELSFNNLADLEGARRIARDFDRACGSDRQAREPVRGRSCGDDRGGVGARARRRPGVGVRLRRAAQPPGGGRLGAGSSSTSSRC